MGMCTCAGMEDMFGITVSRPPSDRPSCTRRCLGVAKKEPGFIDSQAAAQATRVRTRVGVFSKVR